MLLRSRPLLALLLFFAGGCAGPQALRHSRAKYASAVHVTRNEQLLLNLVRLRYRDTPSFLELTNLATQFNFDESASVAGTVKESSKEFNVLGLNAGVDFSERPTASYTPLQGAEFVTRLISPIEEETIVLLTRSGWKGERVFRIAVQSMNGLSNMRGASGPTPFNVRQTEIDEAIRFTRLVRLLEDYSEQRILRFNYEEVEIPKSAAIPSSTVNPQHAVEAAQNGFQIIHPHRRISIDINKIKSESPMVKASMNQELLQSIVAQIKDEGLPRPIRVKYDGGSQDVQPPPEELRLLPANAESQLVLPAPKQESPCFTVVDDEFLFQAVKQIYQDSNGDEFKLVSCDVIEPEKVIVAGSGQKLVMTWDSESNAQMAELKVPHLAENAGRYVLRIEPRSLLGAMYYLSHAIRVPLEHEMAGLVVASADEFGTPFDWLHLSGDLLHVDFSEHKPECASVAVKYRGYWFYIDDRDHSSKATFALLMQLFELRASGGAGRGPVLTLPVGI